VRAGGEQIGLSCAETQGDGAKGGVLGGAVTRAEGA
jgi:hypothetical protein